MIFAPTQVMERYFERRRLVCAIHRARKGMSCANNCVGNSDEFMVRVGLHQGSALRPYLFDLIMDVISEGNWIDAPWAMLCPNDIALVRETKGNFEDDYQDGRELCTTTRKILKIREWMKKFLRRFHH